MTAEPPPPPPPPDGPADDPERDAELFALFRHLRERVFAGSSEIVSHVMRGIEAQIETAPRESFAATLLVQVTNWITSWFDPDARKEDGTGDGGEQASKDDVERPAGDGGGITGDDDE